LLAAFGILRINLLVESSAFTSRWDRPCEWLAGAFGERWTTSSPFAKVRFASSAISSIAAAIDDLAASENAIGVRTQLQATIRDCPGLWTLRKIAECKIQEIRQIKSR
jgi:hypothetical protein